VPSLSIIPGPRDFCSVILPELGLSQVSARYPLYTTNLLERLKMSKSNPSSLLILVGTVRKAKESNILVVNIATALY
jgi:hypothetical protein